MGKTRRSSQRSRDMRGTGFFYKKKFRWVNFCIYCGQAQQCWDHVFPLSSAASLDLTRDSVKKVLFQGLNMVPCCASCNNTAGAERFTNIREKRAYIQKKLRQKHKKILRHIIWDDDEIEGLGKNLRNEVMRMMNNRNLIEMRVSWPAVRTVAKFRNKF